MMEKRQIQYHDREYIVYEDGTIVRPSFINSLGVKYRQKIAGQSSDRGYKKVGGWKDGRAYPLYVHRLVAKAFLNDYADHLHVDHINGDKSDNNASNLRMCTHAQNLEYYHSEQGGRTKIYPKRGKTSRHRGVSFVQRDKKWVSTFRSGGKNIYVGAYDTEREAAIAYNDKAKELLGPRFVPNLIQSL